MRAHTVILGAGATIAAIPNGDKNGRHSSVMNGLIKKLALQDILAGVNLSTKSDNLEDIYSELNSRKDCEDVKEQLEKRLYDYFSLLELPDEPTIYDYLILSLTDKDVIATFNWDPLLIQAYIRCFNITDNLPHLLCLHGNVGMGFCEEHLEFGAIGARCPICGKELPPTRLLYPIKDKNYNNDKYIKGCWDGVQEIIDKSYMLTIFGYSAPTSDRKAMKLLKKAWGKLDDRQLEEVSVIDIIDENKMLKKWEKFIYTHHYRYTNNFFDSYLGLFPRRSCEMVFATKQLNIAPDSTKGFKPNMSWDELMDHIYPLMCEEAETEKGKNYPLHYVKKGYFKN